MLSKEHDIVRLPIAQLLREALEEAIGDDMSDNCSDDSIGCSSDNDDDHDLPVPMYTAASGKLSYDHAIHL